MPAINTIKKFITGLSVRQEYVCLDVARYQNPLSVLLSGGGSISKIDVTDSHLFLGYKPVIIGVPFPVNDSNLDIVRGHARIKLSFIPDESISPNAIASLELEKIGEKVLDENVLLLYEAKFGQHVFLNSLQQIINRWKEVRKPAPSADITLKGNLYDQVRVAYSVPRVISIITITDGYSMNMFPTDLHGPVGKGFYCSSLRIGGKANEQVQKIKKIVLSEVTASSFAETYHMGKNHMRDLQDSDKFQIDQNKSECYKFPLPEHVFTYRELRQFDFLDHGIHRMHFYEVVNVWAGVENSKLAHIHQYFAQWRLNNRLPTNLLLR